MITRFALDGIPFTIYFFIGPIGDNHTGPLHLSTAHVGIVYNFSNPIYTNPASPGCANCRRKAEEGGYETGQIPITNPLAAHALDDTISLTTLEPQDVQGYIQKSLHWQVRTVSTLSSLFPITPSIALPHRTSTITEKNSTGENPYPPTTSSTSSPSQSTREPQTIPPTTNSYPTTTPTHHCSPREMRATSSASSSMPSRRRLPYVGGGWQGRPARPAPPLRG